MTLEEFKASRPLKPRSMLKVHNIYDQLDASSSMKAFREDTVSLLLGICPICAEHVVVAPCEIGGLKHSTMVEYVCVSGELTHIFVRIPS